MPDPKPTLAICLLAALADGERTPEEKSHFARIATELGGEDVAELLMKLQRGDLTLAGAAARLGSADERRVAYEMAVATIYADGLANDRERAFLSELERALALDAAGNGAVAREMEALATAPLAGPTPVATAPRPGRDSGRPSQAGIPAVSHDEALETMILQQALLAGALELLPQNIASLAVIPVQMRLVYRIGADYGHRLDAAQVRDLLGVLGIGAAGQVLDSVVRRVTGGLGRGMLGRMLGGVAGAAAGAGTAFITTYALGHAARQYYAQGRRLSQTDLRALFDRLRDEARSLLPRVQEEIRSQSQALDLSRLLGSIRGA